MSLQLLTLIYAIVFFTTGAVSGTEVKKAVGDEVSFGPDNPLPAPVFSITWKHIKDGETVKVIEWEDGETIIPNPRFNGITTLDMKTGQITITNLTVEHSGVYTLDISGKERAQRFTLTVMGPEEKKAVGAVGDEVSFRPDKPLPASVSSITWKHIKDGETVKAIEWEDGEIQAPNPRFRGITTLDTATGQITITKLTVKHSGVYTIDISGKEQEQRFTLTVMERVPKPVIKREKSDNPGVVYLRCEYSDKIIWKNSAGETLTGSTITPKGESITVKKKENPEIFYTCTLQNTVSEETSDPVYERDLFKEPVPKPVIKKEPSDNPDVWYLRCEYNETIIWKNSAGETLKGSTITPKGESIRVKKIGNPEIFYTCTLQNTVSEETSERVYERDLFKASNKGCVVTAVIPSITMMIIIILFLS